jgi:hypothetical protein
MQEVEMGGREEIHRFQPYKQMVGDMEPAYIILGQVLPVELGDLGGDLPEQTLGGLNPGVLEPLGKDITERPLEIIIMYRAQEVELRVPDLEQLPDPDL